MKKLNKAIPILILCLALGIWLAGCASSGKGARKRPTVTPASNGM